MHILRTTVQVLGHKEPFKWKPSNYLFRLLLGDMQGGATRGFGGIVISIKQSHQ